MLYDISRDCLDSDYHGCGRAWAAVREGQVVAMRYMERYPSPDLPTWASAVLHHCDGLDYRCLPTIHGGRGYSRMAAAARECDDCPRPPRREHYKPGELLSLARDTIAAARSKAFAAWREQCRTELAELGDVISGLASGSKFSTGFTGLV